MSSFLTKQIFRVVYNEKAMNLETEPLAKPELSKLGI